MAPSLQEQASSDKKEVNEADIWKELLGTCSAGTSSTTNNHLFVAGERDCGKSTLTARILGEDIYEGTKEKSVLFDYAFMDVESPEEEDVILGRLNFWALEGDFQSSTLLRHSLNENTLSQSALLLALDLSKPWTVLEAFDRWMNFFSRHIESLELSSSEKKAAQNRVVRLFSRYREPQTTEAPSFGSAISLPTEEPDAAELELGEGVLTSNLGVPVVVVGCKADLLDSVASSYGWTEEHHDTLQHALRSRCLQYGAALVFTSGLLETNCDLLYQYFTHLFHGAPCTHPAQVLERESVFIPIGWDTQLKIELLQQGRSAAAADARFHDLIVKPVQQATDADVSTQRPEVVCEDEQAFLRKHQKILERAEESKSRGSDMLKKLSSRPKADGQINTSMLSASRLSRTTTTTTAPAPVPATAAAGAVGPASGSAAGDQEVLQDFFAQLLNKNSRVPSRPTSTKPTEKK
eukprot:GCRY01002979.1.p1 GENE.GCRY01002979.1~~GCRY01002979.1.p1  ORF type:complete len:465 (-),score=110.76 GCRY01002979.1:507-1901(-)